MSFFSLQRLQKTYGKSGFTLVEIMIVIVIIVTLLSIAWFPYSYYMERAYVENTIDTIGQEWILAQKDIRNGKMFSTSKHANKILVFRKGSRKIESYLYSGTLAPPVEDLTLESTNPHIRFEKEISFESSIMILDFTGSHIQPDAQILGYFIQAPYATGAFFSDTDGEFFSSGEYLIVGYTGAELDTGRSRKILLRPYLQ